MRYTPFSTACINGCYCGTLSLSLFKFAFLSENCLPPEKTLCCVVCSCSLNFLCDSLSVVLLKCYCLSATNSQDVVYKARMKVLDSFLTFIIIYNNYGNILYFKFQ